MALSPPELLSVFGVASEEAVTQDQAGFLHQGVTYSELDNKVHPTILGDDPSPGGFFEASLRCPGLVGRSVDQLQCPCQEKRKQARRGSNLPRNILVSDAPQACQPLAEVLGQGPLRVSAKAALEPSLRKSLCRQAFRNPPK